MHTRPRKRTPARMSADRHIEPREGWLARYSAAWMVCVEEGGGGGYVGLCNWSQFHA